MGPMSRQHKDAHKVAYMGPSETAEPFLGESIFGGSKSLKFSGISQLTKTSWNNRQRLEPGIPARAIVCALVAVGFDGLRTRRR